MPDCIFRINISPVYKEIFQCFLAGESQRSIEKSMNISRNTVKKYCEGANVPCERKTPERQSTTLTDGIISWVYVEEGYIDEEYKGEEYIAEEYGQVWGEEDADIIFLIIQS